MSISDSERVSIDRLMREAFFAGSNYDEYIKDAVISDPNDHLHEAFDKWKKEFWAVERKYWEEKSAKENE